MLQLSKRLQDTSLLGSQVVAHGTRCVTADTFVVDDPATGATLARVPNLDASAASGVIEIANAALSNWRARTGHDRASIIRRWFELMIEHVDDLAAILTAEQGKPLAEAKAEVLYGASFVEWFAEEAKRVTGDVLASPASDKRLLVLKQPIGVCAAITPWNFPVAMITRKVAPALAAGCTIVVKPAEQTPLSALALAELAQRAGMPAGVLNVMTADSERSIAIGRALCASPVVRHLSFTGSTSVGRILMAQCAPTVKKLALELGGHAPFIVFEDADLDAAVAGALVSKFRNAGQTCVCTNRFYVHENVYDAFVKKFAALAAKLPVGSGFVPGVQVGPMIDEAAVNKVQQHVDDALALGARLITGGCPATGHGSARFYPPTVLCDATSAMHIAREETFGPVAAIFPFHSEAEVVAQANDTDSGLAAYFYSRDVARVWRVAEALEYGMVGINTGLISTEVSPFGGVKQSGLGREGSRYGIDEYLEMKALSLGAI